MFDTEKLHAMLMGNAMESIRRMTSMFDYRELHTALAGNAMENIGCMTSMFDSKELRAALVGNAMENIERMTSVFDSKELRTALAGNAMESIRHMTSMFGSIELHAVLMGNTVETIKRITSSALLNDFKSFDNIELMNRLNVLSDTLQSLGDNFDEEFYDEKNTFENDFSLTNEQQIEVANMIDTLITQPTGYRDVIIKKLKKWKNKEYQIDQLLKLVRWICGFLIAAYITHQIPFLSSERQLATKTKACLYDDNAEIITVIPKNVFVIIVEDMRYWYRVEYNNADTSEVYCGKAAKRNFEKQEKEHGKYDSYLPILDTEN